MSARDIVIIGVVIFAIATGLFIIHYVSSQITDSLTSIEMINDTQGVPESLAGLDTMVARLDYVVFALFLGLILAFIITGWFIASNPLFMFIYFILAIIGVVVSTFLDNLWDTISNTLPLSASLAAFPITNNILSNLPIYVAVIATLGVVVMFGKPYITGET